MKKKKNTRKSGSLEAKNKAMSGDSTHLDCNDIIALFFCLLKMQKPVKICLKSEQPQTAMDGETETETQVICTTGSLLHKSAIQY